jgi:hypothetical protein
MQLAMNGGGGGAVLGPQSRQIAKLFLQSSESGFPPPPPHTQAGVEPPSFGSGGEGGTLASQVGEGVPMRTRGQTLWYSRHIGRPTVVIYKSLTDT